MIESEDCAYLAVAHERGTKCLQQHQKQEDQSTQTNVLRGPKPQLHFAIASAEGDAGRGKAGSIGRECVGGVVKDAAINLDWVQAICILLTDRSTSP